MSIGTYGSTADNFKQVFYQMKVVLLLNLSIVYFLSIPIVGFHPTSLSFSACLYTSSLDASDSIIIIATLLKSQYTGRLSQILQLLLGPEYYKERKHIKLCYK